MKGHFAGRSEKTFSPQSRGGPRRSALEIHRRSAGSNPDPLLNLRGELPPLSREQATVREHYVPGQEAGAVAYKVECPCTRCPVVCRSGGAEWFAAKGQ